MLPQVLYKSFFLIIHVSDCYESVNNHETFSPAPPTSFPQVETSLHITLHLPPKNYLLFTNSHHVLFSWLAKASPFSQKLWSLALPALLLTRVSEGDVNHRTGGEGSPEIRQYEQNLLQITAATYRQSSEQHWTPSAITACVHHSVVQVILDLG